MDAIEWADSTDTALLRDPTNHAGGGVGRGVCSHRRQAQQAIVVHNRLCRPHCL